MHFSEEGISNQLANYMTMALDPNVGHIVKFMEKNIPKYRERLAKLEDELQKQLKSTNSTLVELFHKVAVRYALENLNLN